MSKTNRVLDMQVLVFGAFAPINELRRRSHLLTDLGQFAVGGIDYAHSPFLVITGFHYDSRYDQLYAD